MTAEQAIAYIHSVFWKGSIPGLGRTQTLLKKMGNPEKKLKFVHVAGTNGKGSVCAYLRGILTEAGYTCGVFTSPHLVEPTERFRVGEKEISKGEFRSVCQAVGGIDAMINEECKDKDALALVK